MEEELTLEGDSQGSPMEADEMEESFAHRMFHTALVVDKYYTPLLFLFGTLGNSLSVAVFCMNAKYRSQSASYYLSALAISDTGFLVNLLAVWLENVHGGVITSGILCPLVMYLGQVTCFMSVYLTVAFSIERFIAVNYPLSRPRICTRSKARKVIAALTAVSLLVFSYAWVIAQVIEMPLQREDYDELYQDNVLPENSWNLTGDGGNSLELSPTEQRAKRESFPLYTLSPQELQTSYASSKQLNNIFGQVQDCANGNLTSSNESFPFQHAQSKSPPCGRLYSEGTIFQRFDNSFSPGAADRETSTSVENINNMINGEGSGEEFLSGGFICSVPKDYYRISEIANYLDSVVTLIIPFFLITFFNVRIAICVWKLKDQRQNIVASGNTDINYHHNHHNSNNLRCSTKSSVFRHKNSKKKAEDDGAIGDGGGLRKNICQRGKHKDNNGIIRGGSDEKDFETSHRKSQKGTVRFHDGCNTLKATGQNNDSTLSSSGSEESRLADNFREDDDNSNPRSTQRQHPELALTANRMSTGEGVGNKSTKFIRRPISSDQLAGGMKMKWEKEFSEQGSLPQRVVVKPELSVVKERGSGNHPSSNAAEVRVTKTLLLVSTVFLVLNLPAHAIRCALFIQSLRGTSDGNELLHAAQPWTNILFNTNFAVNFLLYCVSGRNFRKSIRSIILRKCSKNKTNAWKPVKTSLKKESNLKQVAGGAALKRNCSKDMQRQVTEIVEVELEDRREESVYPRPNQTHADVNYNSELEESMTV